MSETRAADPESLASVVAEVCQRIPPLWDLRNYVAVNPFLGFAGQRLEVAAQVIGDGLSARVLPGVEHYRARWHAGAFRTADLAGAGRRGGADPEALEAILTGRRVMPLRASYAVATRAERIDKAHGTEWNDRVVRWVTHWCAIHVSGGGPSWSLPSSALYGSWREAAQVDLTLELEGLRGWRAWAGRLPDQPGEVFPLLLSRLEIPPQEQSAYLYRLLAGVYGWASLFRQSTWQQGSDPGPVADLLAIRLATDAAVAELVPWSERLGSDVWPSALEDERTLLHFQEALEDGFTRKLLGKIATGTQRQREPRPAVQAVFCIDVRSEPLRRHLEAQSSKIETRGFAGFFGVALDWQVGGEPSARCPVLLRPAVLATPTISEGVSTGWVKNLQTGPAVSFSYVELLGLAYGLTLAGDALNLLPTGHAGEAGTPFQLPRDKGLALEGRVDLAAGILKNMGLRDTFARLVLLCGHEGESANNAHAAGLDCGACGGHSGAINARVAAALLEDPAVREGLAERGWRVPADTRFLPGVHNTTTDAVTLLDTENVPSTHRVDLDSLRSWLEEAGRLVRTERATALGFETKPRGLLARLFRRRARDWSEVRPEWGLARNAAFLAARRERTRGVDLEGRVFLHEYDATTDPEDSILTLILSAPMVVAAWINLQYLASTVDNDVFGCGTKALHNRVGTHGVVLGNGGDLRTGLSVQSVHTAAGHWYHEPLRLQVIVEANPERIDRVLAAQPGVRDLVANGWVRLFALDRECPRLLRWVAGQAWEPLEADGE